MNVGGVLRLGRMPLPHVGRHRGQSTKGKWFDSFLRGFLRGKHTGRLTAFFQIGVGDAAEQKIQT